MLRTTIIILSAIMVVAGISCTIVSQQATPAEVDQKALQYAVDAGVADFNDYDAWYPNLAEAIRLVQDVEHAHVLNRQALEQAIQKEDTAYSIHTNTTIDNKQKGIHREEALFGEKGLLSMGLSMLGIGGMGGMIGLMRKRPGDITKPEMEQALATATGKTSAELSVKEKQFVQLVKGVQAFTETYKGTTDNSTAVILQTLKQELNSAQDKDTQAAVAVIKKTV